MGLDGSFDASTWSRGAARRRKRCEPTVVPTSIIDRARSPVGRQAPTGVGARCRYFGVRLWSHGAVRIGRASRKSVGCPENRSGCPENRSRIGHESSMNRTRIGRVCGGNRSSHQTGAGNAGAASLPAVALSARMIRMPYPGCYASPPDVRFPGHAHRPPLAPSGAWRAQIPTVPRTTRTQG